MSDDDWVLVDLEPAAAARAGLPSRLAAPRSATRAGLPLERETAAAWAAEFADDFPEHALAAEARALAESEPLRQRALELAALGHHADAAEVLAEASTLAPFDAAARFNRATALRLAGDAEGSLAQLDEVEWAYGDQAAWLAARGRAFELLDEPERAIDAYERALALMPGDPFLIDRLTALGALARFDAPDGESYWLATADFERVVRHQMGAVADDPAALTDLGERLIVDGHVELARSALALARSAGGDAAHGVDRLAARIDTYTGP